MIKKEDIKIGLEFRWDKERIEVMDDGRYGHYYETDSIPYFLTNDSKFPTLFTISTNGGNTVTCSDCASIRVLVIKKDDIAEYAHIESTKEEELDEGSLSVPSKVKFDDMNLALHHAEDVATMRQILLQISRWFKTGHKELPFTFMAPFHDEMCNDMYEFIVELMKKESDE